MKQNITLEKCLRYQFAIELPAQGNLLPLEGEILGGSTARRPTEFKTFLNEQKTQGHSNTTVTVTSVQTKDLFYIDPQLLGNTIVLSINPGASNSETVKCTSFTTSTKQFSGCTFGYRFDDPLTTAPEDILAHSPGEPIIISNTDQFLANVYFNLPGDNTATGSSTVSGSFLISSTTVSSSLFLGTGSTVGDKCIQVKNGTGGANNLNNPKLCYVESGDAIGRWLIYNNGISSFDIMAGGSGLSAGLGIRLSASRIIIDTTFTTGTTGLGFLGNTLVVSTTIPNGLFTNLDGLAIATATAQLSWAASSSFVGNAYNGLYILNATTTNATTTNFGATSVSSTFAAFGTVNAMSIVNGGTLFNASSSFGGNAYNGLYIQNSTTTNATTTNFSAVSVSTTFLSVGTINSGVTINASSSFTGNAYNGLYAQNATTTNATTTNLGVTNLVSSTNAIFGTASSTRLFVNGNNANTLLTNSTTVANETHYHASQCTLSSVNYDNSGTQPAQVFTFGHNLGVIPSVIRYDVYTSAPTAGYSYSHGVYTSSTNFTSQFAAFFNTAQAAGTDTAVPGVSIHLIDSNNTLDSEATTLVPTNTTQVSINITTNAAGGGRRRIVAELCK